MRYLIAKDKKVRKFFVGIESEYVIVKALSMSQRITIWERMKWNKKLSKMKLASRVKLRNRCLLTGRARAVFRDIHMARMKVRDYMRSGCLYGVKKSSW